MTNADHHFEVKRAITRPKLKVLAGMLVLSGMAGISVQPLKAQNQNSLDLVLAQFADSGKIQAGANLPVQKGFANGGLAVYITPEVGVDPNNSFVSTAQGIDKGFNANFIPANWATLPGSAAVRSIFVLLRCAVSLCLLTLRKATCLGSSRIRQVLRTRMEATRRCGR
jgi:hypothetical protein